MSPQHQFALQQAATMQGATKLELDAALLSFQAAVQIGEPARLNAATENAQAALQAHLDAIAGLWACAKRSAGR